MTKRRADSEHRAFQTRWEADDMFTDITGRPVRLTVEQYCILAISIRGYVQKRLIFVCSINVCPVRPATLSVL